MAAKGKTTALTLAFIAIVALAAAVTLGRQEILAFLRRPRPEERRLLPVASGGFAGMRIDIAPGEIEVAEFIRFLGEYTGLPIVHDSNAPWVKRQQKILIAAPMKDVDGEIVRAILEANGFRVTVDELPGGKQIVRMASEASP